MAMLLKVLYKVNFRKLTQTYGITYIITNLLPFAKPLELIAINHSLSERRIIFFLGH